MSYIKYFAFVALIGAFLLSACGTQTGTQANPDGSVNVNVTLTDFKVQSSVTEFKPGVMYHFVVKNEGQVAHEFMIMPITMDNMGMTNLSSMSMEEKDSMALMMIPQEQLAPGATTKADYTFTSMPQGNIEIVCTLPGHYEAGMHMPVTFK
ncbi:MAG: hypothetical protein HY258_09220 [Chloroflexi bacterium]|nr:hypothetical protein [Chloroflexota bacterium]